MSETTNSMTAAIDKAVQPTAGLSVNEVTDIARQFLDDLNVSEKNNLEIQIYPNVRMAFGPRVDQSGGRIKGAFLPAIQGSDQESPRSRGRNTVVLISAHLSSRADVEETLRHEILGHYGINLLPPDDKRRFLEAIDRSRDYPQIRALAKEVEGTYPDRDRLKQAEEILALAAERLPQNVFARTFERAARVLATGLRKIGLLKGTVLLSEMQGYLRSVAKAIGDGAQQRTYPATRAAQFAQPQVHRPEPRTFDPTP